MSSVFAVCALAACSSAPTPTFDLSAPAEVRSPGSLDGHQLVIPEPMALQTLSGQQIVVRSAGNEISALKDAQWADRLPALVQTRLIETFQNASRLAKVGRPGDGMIADYQLTSDIRQFQVAGDRGEAVVELAVRIVSTATGKVIRARIFSARVPLASVTGASAAVALDQALSSVLRDIVRWAAIPATA